MNKLDVMLWRMVTRSKGQAAAVLVVIALGVSLFTALAPVGQHLEDSTLEYYREQSFADAGFYVEHLPASVIDDVRSIEGVRQVEGRISVELSLVTEPGDRANVRLLSVPGGGPSINRLLLREGRLIRDPDKDVLVIAQFADARGIRPGDEIAVRAGGHRIDLVVAGIVRSPEFIYLIEDIRSMMPAGERYGILYADERLAALVPGTEGAYNEALVLYENGIATGAGSGKSEEAVIGEIENILRPYGLRATVPRADQISHALVNEEVEGVKSMGGSVSVLFLFVAAAMIAMMVSRMVKKDRVSIGVLKALGYSDRAILVHYIKYAAASGLIGGLAGIAFGYGLALALNDVLMEFFEIPGSGLNIDLSYIAGGLLLSCALCTAAGLYGARGIQRIAPAVSMQPEAPREGRHILAEHLPVVWRRLRFSQKLVVKNVFRNKKRSAFVMAGVALTFALLLFTTTLPGVVDEMLIKQYEEHRTMDYEVRFSAPVASYAVADLTGELAGRSRAEGRIEDVFELSAGHRRKTATVTGLASPSAMVHLQDLDQRPVAAKPGQVLLSQNLADALRVVPGDRLSVRSLASDERETTLVVGGIVRQMLGINAYMDLEDMGERLLERGAVNGAYIGTGDPDAVQALQEIERVSSVSSSGDMGAMFGEYMRLTRVMITAMVILSGILGFAIVYSATVISIGERKTELSSLRVMGFYKDEIFGMILAETVLISAAGFAAGVPLGRMMTAYSEKAFSTDMYTLYMAPTPSAVFYSAVLTLLFLAAAGIATYGRIRRLDFLQALKDRIS